MAVEFVWVLLKRNGGSGNDAKKFVLPQNHIGTARARKACQVYWFSCVIPQHVVRLGTSGKNSGKTISMSIDCGRGRYRQLESLILAKHPTHFLRTTDTTMFSRRSHGFGTPPSTTSQVSKTHTLDSAGKSETGSPARTSSWSAMRSWKWWWRIPAYLVFQMFIWVLVSRQSWPAGRDVFGPYKLEPDSIVAAYWIQFVLFPFISMRFRIFALSQLVVLVLVYVLPDWPRAGNVFAPFIRVPSSVWPLYWIQFFAVLVLVWRVPSLIRKWVRHDRDEKR